MSTSANNKLFNTTQILNTLGLMPLQAVASYCDLNDLSSLTCTSTAAKKRLCSDVALKRIWIPRLIQKYERPLSIHRAVTASTETPLPVSLLNYRIGQYEASPPFIAFMLKAGTPVSIHTLKHFLATHSPYEVSFKSALRGAKSNRISMEQFLKGVDLLLGAGVSFSDANVLGKHAVGEILAVACGYKSKELMERLVKAGACAYEGNPNNSYYGNTFDEALSDLGNREGGIESLTLLMKYGAKPSGNTRSLLQMLTEPEQSEWGSSKRTPKELELTKKLEEFITPLLPPVSQTADDLKKEIDNAIAALSDKS